MRNILLALNDQKLNIETVEFACYMARLLKARLTGVFVERKTADIPQFERTGKAGGDITFDELPAFDQNAASFCDACIQRDTQHTIHRNKRLHAGELVLESRFADLLILDPEISLSGIPENFPASVTRYFMHKAACPVIIAPGNFETIDGAIFTFDGSASSIYAIKQFAYLFPGFAQEKIAVLQVNKCNEAAEKKFSEWLYGHFSDVEYIVMDGDPLNKLFGHILLRNNAFVVMGAYKRNIVSEIAGWGVAGHLIGTIANPVFIARP